MKPTHIRYTTGVLGTPSEPAVRSAKLAAYLEPKPLPPASEGLSLKVATGGRKIRYLCLLGILIITAACVRALDNDWSIRGKNKDTSVRLPIGLTYMYIYKHENISYCVVYDYSVECIRADTLPYYCFYL